MTHEFFQAQDTPAVIGVMHRKRVPKGVGMDIFFQFTALQYFIHYVLNTSVW
jgi:hypothetical protein